MDVYLRQRSRRHDGVAEHSKVRRVGVGYGGRKAYGEAVVDKAEEFKRDEEKFNVARRSLTNAGSDHRAIQSLLWGPKIFKSLWGL